MYKQAHNMCCEKVTNYGDAPNSHVRSNQFCPAIASHQSLNCYTIFYFIQVYHKQGMNDYTTIVNSKSKEVLYHVCTFLVWWWWLWWWNAYIQFIFHLLTVLLLQLRIACFFFRSFIIVSWSNGWGWSNVEHIIHTIPSCVYK